MRLVSLSAFVVVALAATSRTAHAYPEFQFSQGVVRCSLCHYSPTGGGLLNNFGRGEAEGMSLWGGDPDFLYGIWKSPKWIKLGVDFRVASFTRTNGSDRELLVFPMQGDTYVDLFFGDVTISTIFGPRAQARTPRESAAARMNSREHWVMWRPKTTGPYVRVGRFFAPFGLRQQDHTVFNRRFLGFHSFEESYNLTGGYVKNDFEAHASLFAPAPGPLQTVLGGGPASFGASGYYERRMFDKAGAVAGQAKVARTDNDMRYIVGGVGKYYLEAAKLLLMGELDLGLQTFDASGSPSRAQMTAYLSASYRPLNYLMVTAALQRHDNDLSIGDDGYDAMQLSFQFFARTHIELHTLYRLEFSGDYQKPRGLAFLMAHYWL